MISLKKSTKGFALRLSSRQQYKLHSFAFWNAAILAAIFLLAVWLRFTGLMPNIQHPDEAYTEKVVAQLRETSQPNPHAFKYGSLHFYLNLLAVKTVSPILDGLDQLTGFAQSKPDLSHALSRKDTRRLAFDPWVMRGLTAVLGALTVLVVYQLGLMLFDRHEVGLAAAIFMAVSPLHVTNSHWITTDILGTLLLYLAFLYSVKLWRLGDRARLKDFLIAGLLVGIAASVRYQPLGLVPYGAAFALVWRFNRKRLGCFAIGLVAAVAGFLIANPLLLAELPQVRYDFVNNILPWYRPKVGWWFLHIIPIPEFGFNGWYLRELMWTGTGISVAVLGFIGLILAIFRKQWQPILMIAAVTAPIVILVTGYLGPTWNRLIIPAIPGIAILAGFGSVELAHRLARRFAKAFQIVLLVALVAAPSFPQLKASAQASLACGKPTTTRQERDWVAQHIDPDASIIRGPLVSIPQERTSDHQPYHDIEVTFDKVFSLPKIQELGAQYFILNADVVKQNFTWQQHGFSPNPLPGQYLYRYLALRHWDTNYIPGSGLLQQFNKPALCGDFDIRIYQVGKEPVLTEPASVTEYDFTKPSDSNLWQLYALNHLDLSGERLYPSDVTIDGLHFDTDSASLPTFRLVGPESALKKDLFYRVTVDYHIKLNTTPKDTRAFANVEVFRKPRKNRIEGDFNAVSARSFTVNAPTQVSVLVRSPEHAATFVPSFGIALDRGAAQVVIKKVTIEEFAGPKRQEL